MPISSVNLKEVKGKGVTLLKNLINRKESIFSFENKPEKSSAYASQTKDPEVISSNKTKGEPHVFESTPCINEKIDVRALDEYGLQKIDCGTYQNNIIPTKHSNTSTAISDDDNNNEILDHTEKYKMVLAKFNVKNASANMTNKSDSGADPAERFIAKMTQNFNKMTLNHDKSKDYSNVDNAKNELKRGSDDIRDYITELRKCRQEINTLKAEIKVLKNEIEKYEKEELHEKVDECKQRIERCNQEIIEMQQITAIYEQCNSDLSAKSIDKEIHKCDKDSALDEEIESRENKGGADVENIEFRDSVGNEGEKGEKDEMNVDKSAIDGNDIATNNTACDYEEVDKLDFHYKLDRLDATVVVDSLLERKAQDEVIVEDAGDEMIVEDAGDEMIVEDAGDEVIVEDAGDEMIVEDAEGLGKSDNVLKSNEELVTDSNCDNDKNRIEMDELVKEDADINENEFVGVNNGAENIERYNRDANNVFTSRDKIDTQIPPIDAAPQNSHISNPTLSSTHTLQHGDHAELKLPPEAFQDNFDSNSLFEIDRSGNNMTKPGTITIDAKAGDSTSCQIPDTGVFENTPVSAPNVHARSGVGNSLQKVESGTFENKPAINSSAHVISGLKGVQKVDSGIYENQPTPRTGNVMSSYTPSAQKLDSGTYESEPSATSKADVRSGAPSMQKIDSGTYENQPTATSKADVRSGAPSMQKIDSGTYENQPTATSKADARSGVQSVQKLDSGTFENQPTATSKADVRSGAPSMQKIDSGTYENQPTATSKADARSGVQSVQKLDSGTFENQPTATSKADVRSGAPSIQKIESGTFENEPTQYIMRSRIKKDSSQVYTPNDSSKINPSITQHHNVFHQITSSKQTSPASRSTSPMSDSRLNQSNQQNTSIYQPFGKEDSSLPPKRHHPADESVFENQPQDTTASFKSSDVLPEIDNGVNVFEKRPSDSFTDARASDPSLPMAPLSRINESRVFDEYEQVNSQYAGNVFDRPEDNSNDTVDIMSHLQDAISDLKRGHVYS